MDTNTEKRFINYIANFLIFLAINICFLTFMWIFTMSIVERMVPFFTGVRIVIAFVMNFFVIGFILKSLTTRDIDNIKNDFELIKRIKKQ